MVYRAAREHSSSRYNLLREQQIDLCLPQSRECFRQLETRISQFPGKSESLASAAKSRSVWPERKRAIPRRIEGHGEGPRERTDKGKVGRSAVSAAIALLAWKSSYSSRALETMRAESNLVQCRLGRAGWVSATKITPAGEYYGTLQ